MCLIKPLSHRHMTKKIHLRISEFSFAQVCFSDCPHRNDVPGAFCRSNASSGCFVLFPLGLSILAWPTSLRIFCSHWARRFGSFGKLKKPNLFPLTSTVPPWLLLLLKHMKHRMMGEGTRQPFCQWKAHQEESSLHDLLSGIVQSSVVLYVEVVVPEKWSSG